MASQITSLTIVYLTVYSGRDQRKHQKLRVTDLVWGIHRWPVNSPHKGPVMQKMSPSDDVIMKSPQLCVIFDVWIKSYILYRKWIVFFETRPLLSVGVLPNYDWHGSQFHVALPPWTPVWNGFSVKPMPQHSFWSGSYSKPNQWKLADYYGEYYTI